MNSVPDRVVIDKSSAKLASLRAANMIRKEHIRANGTSAFQTFAALAA